MSEIDNRLKNIDKEKLEAMSPEERDLALSILSELSKTGNSKILNNLMLEDYAEVPVDILTFVDDYNYLGNAWHDAEGKSKLYPYWRKELKKIFPNNLDTNVNNAIFSGSRGRGKAQPLDSLVFTEKGYVKMRDLTIGDYVYGDDGKLHPILGIYPQGKKDIYKITFSDKSEVLCSDEHLWYVRDNNDMKWKTLELKDILRESLIRKSSAKGIKECRYKIPLTAPIQFEHKDTFISPYLMGCLLGDGCFSNSIMLTTYDNEIVEYLKKELSNNNYTYSIDRNSYIIKQVNRSGNNRYKKEIISLNLYKHTADKKFIPDIYLYNDTESRLELLQGLLDTDGTIVENGSSITFSTCSELLANQIVFLVQSLGGTSHIRYRLNRTYKYKGEVKHCRDCFTVAIKLPANIIPFKLTRKINRLNKNRLEPQRNIKSIEYIGKDDCQCIYIDYDKHLYLTDNLIVTHNTEVATLVAAYLLHRILCLKDPVAHFHLKPTEKIVFAFMNIKLALAEEIGISKFQNTIQSSPWFMNHGTLEGRTKKIWIPQKYNGQEAIDIKIGSQSDDLIGLPVYCLAEDTIINTLAGDFKIKDLVNQEIQVINTDEMGNQHLSDVCTVKATGISDVEYEIELEDGSTIKCTPNHRFLLTSGIYKEAKDLTEADEIAESGKHDMSGYTEDMRKHRKELASGENNPMFGKGYLRCGGNNTNSHIRYFYKDKIFECRKELVEYLKANVAKTISASLIRRIENDNYSIRTVKKYQFVIDALSWEAK